MKSNLRERVRTLYIVHSDKIVFGTSTVLAGPILYVLLVREWNPILAIIVTGLCWLGVTFSLGTLLDNHLAGAGDGWRAGWGAGYGGGSASSYASCPTCGRDADGPDGMHCCEHANMSDYYR